MPRVRIPACQSPMPDPRVELGTPASSGQRSADELVRHTTSAGRELTTPASSGLRSTTELPRLFKLYLVGVLGIEPSLHEPESCVLPAYSTP